MEQITKEELLDVTGKFELGNHIEVVSVEPYGSGHINDTFRLEVKEDGKEKLYILQRMNKDIFKNQKELMDNILQVTSFLTEKIKEQGGDPNRETLQVIPTKEGKAYLTEENGDGWRVYPFITDSLSFDKADTPEAMKRVVMPSVISSTSYPISRRKSFMRRYRIFITQLIVMQNSNRRYRKM